MYGCKEEEEKKVEKEEEEEVEEEQKAKLDTPGRLINSSNALLTLCVCYLAVRAASVVDGQRRLCDGPAH